ncbi:aldose 1-epimerase family protein [Chitinophaga lutea]
MPEIANEFLQARLNEKGAELQSIYRKDNKLEYLWSGDPAFWGKKSPVLFPIVGGLRDNTYHYKGQTYQLGRHGFARDMVFDVAEQTAHSVSFSLRDDDSTLRQYPFPFSLRIRYALQDVSLFVQYSVQNLGDVPMYFSIGAHPAFRVPLTPDTTYEDYFLRFAEPENAPRWPLAASGLISDTPVPYLQHTQELPLRKEMFREDALVFKHLASTSLSIRSAKTPHGVEVHFPGFPYLGIWAARNADFVCIEPWYGIADHESATGNIIEKEGMLILGPDEVFQTQWSAIFF